MIWSGNALELGGSNLSLKFFASEGIIHQTSWVHTPQQNGVAKRKHSRLLEVSRALFHQSKLLIFYWEKCLLTTTFLINRYPSRILKGMILEKLFKKPPTYSCLISFGCLCHAVTSSQNREKFKVRSAVCVFIGYPYEKKGYKLLELSSWKIFIFRNVIFNEDVHIFFISSNQSNRTPTFHTK